MLFGIVYTVSSDRMELVRSQRIFLAYESGGTKFLYDNFGDALLAQPIPSRAVHCSFSGKRRGALRDTSSPCASEVRSVHEIVSYIEKSAR